MQYGGGNVEQDYYGELPQYEAERPEDLEHDADVLIDAYPQYRQSLTAIHKNNLPTGALNSVLPGNAPSPAAGGSPYANQADGSHSRPGTSQYNGPVGQNRPGQQGKPMSIYAQ